MNVDGTEGPTVVSDAAHILGTTPSSLVHRSAQIKKLANSSSNLKKPKDLEMKGSRTVGKRELKAGIKSKTSLAADPSPSSSSSSSFPNKEKGAAHAGHSSLQGFLTGATAAQQTQIRMISRVFEVMDADSDGQLSVADVRAYFRTIGRNASDLSVRKWISQRDVDQDGSVSLVEFIASYSQQLDPASSVKCGNGNITDIPFVRTSSSLTEAFGLVCLGNTPSEVTDACMATEEYVQRILDSPSVQSFWRIFVSDEAFHRRIGRLFGGLKLIQSMGFEPEQNGTVLALRDPNGRIWDVLPTDVRVLMNMRLQELKNHENALLEPTVSNIAAGMTDLYCHYLELISQS